MIDQYLGRDRELGFRSRAELLGHVVTCLGEKIARGRAIGVKDNMALVGILSAQLLVERFISNVPRVRS